MAYVIECIKCGKLTAVSISDGCLECAAIEAKQRKVGFMAGRAALTIEERLALIEAQLFDLSLRPSWPSRFG